MRIVVVAVAALLAHTANGLRRRTESAPKLAPAAIVEDMPAFEGGASEPSTPAPMNETEVRSLNGVHVTVWQPPHAVRSEDWRRVGEAVHRVCSEQHLPLDGNTFCVCRLRVPLDCRCHHVDPHPEGDEEAKEEVVKDAGEERREKLKAELQGILDESAKNRTEAMSKAIEAKKQAMRAAHQRRKDALRKWWTAEEARVDSIRDARVPDELRRLLEANHARDDAERRRREEAEARARAAKQVVEDKARELEALRDRLKQIGDLRAAKADRKRVERDIKSKQAEINRLIESLELLKHDNELRAVEYEEWAARAKALEERYRQMLRNLGPWGEAVLARLERELSAALDKVTEEHNKRVAEEKKKLDEAQAAFNKMKHDAFHKGGSDKDRIAALRKQIAAAEARYQAMLRNVNNVTDATPCRSHQDCGAEQRCSNMLCTTIAPGSPCAQHEMCANEQRCTAGRCAVVEENAQCTVKRDCGNWQKCNPDSKCVVVFDGTPCRSAEKTCANLHVCDAEAKECRGEYDLEEELARRRKDEEALRKQLDVVTEQHVKKLEREVHRMREKHIADSDVVKQVQTLAVERRKLEAGRVRLERELQRRAAAYMAGETLPRGAGVAGAMAPGAMSGSSPLDAATEIRKLEEEIERLEEELGKCKSKPHAYVPTCESDLTFQIERLREEVLRRKALLLEEVEQVKGKEKEVASQLAKCRAEGGGCPPEEEQRLLLSMKNLEDEVERRETEQAEQDKVHIMQCLLDHDKNPHLSAVRKMFKASLDDGCRRISALSGVGDLETCLCSDWKKESAIRMKAQQRAAQAEHDRQAAEQTEVTQRAVSERKRSQQKEMAKEVAKELLYEHLKQEGKLDGALSEARKQNPALADRLLAEARAMAEDPKATLREVTSAVAAAAAAGENKASPDLAQSVAGLLTEAEAARAPKEVLEPLTLAKKAADAGRAVQEVADNLSEAEAAGKANALKGSLMASVTATAKLASDAAAHTGEGDLTPGGDPLVPLSKVDTCLSDIDSDAVKDNIRKAFSSGHARNGCALLSLASNEVLVRVHKCVCADIEAGGSS